MPLTIKELGIVLRAESRDKNGKLFFNCEKTENHLAVLLDNYGAQFWIHYFRCGIGLVNLSFFNHLASAEGSLTDQTRNAARTALNINGLRTNCLRSFSAAKSKEGRLNDWAIISSNV